MGSVLGDFVLAEVYAVSVDKDTGLFVGLTVVNVLGT